MEEEAEEDALGYLLLATPPWIFDLLGGVTPLLQVGLSVPRRKKGRAVSSYSTCEKCIEVCTSGVLGSVIGSTAGAEAR